MSSVKRKSKVDCSITSFLRQTPKSSTVEDRQSPQVSVPEEPSTITSSDQHLVEVQSLSKASKVKSTLYQNWIKLKGFNMTLNMNVFGLHADGGIICILYCKHINTSSNRGAAMNVYTKVSAKPKRPNRLDKHLEGEQHRNAVALEETQRSSVFHTQYEDRVSAKTKTISQRIHLIIGL